MSQEERRGSPRQQVAIHVRAEGGFGLASGTLRSLSRMGALVEVDVALPIGAPLRLALAGERQLEELELHGQVVRREGHLIGIMFAPLPPSALGRIDAMLSSLLEGGK